MHKNYLKINEKEFRIFNFLKTKLTNLISVKILIVLCFLLKWIQQDSHLFYINSIKKKILQKLLILFFIALTKVYKVVTLTL